MNPKPTNVTLNKTEGYLEITWQEGHTCQYPLPQLREACPCVECRGGHQFMGPAFEPDNLLALKPKRSYTVTEVQLVGNYAIQPTWDDGHQTGIYSWDYLYRLCPEE
ncbi:MAG: hypothetical protein OHK0046_05100 [Anaerolineae bacterium]